MLKNLLLLFFITFYTTLWAQTGTLHGKVIDSDTGEPLIGASVIVPGARIGGIADLQGEYVIKNVPVGNVILEFSYVGYENTTTEITVKAAETVEVGTTSLLSKVMGLKDVEVFASVVEDRKTPVAVSAINALEIDERYAGASLPDIMQSTPGVFATQGAGGYGDEEIYVRGFNQANVAFLVNGIPVNDMENGSMYWSNFAGLNEVTRQMQVQRGLGASKLAISSIGGTINMITNPAERKEGGKIEYQTGQGSWNNRLRVTYHTGEFGHGWSASFQGSRTTTSGSLGGRSATESGGILPGAYTDAWSYYLAISKRINNKHQIMFWGFGAPVDRGSAWMPDDETREAFHIQKPNFNNIIGYYQGDLYNARQNKLHTPVTAITHYWDIDANTHLTTSVYTSFAKVYSTQPRDAENSLFLPVRSESNPNFDSYDIDHDQAFTTDGLINWDYLASINTSSTTTVEFPDGDVNTPSITGHASRFYLESRHNDHNWVGLISNLRKTLGNLELLGGIDLRHYRGYHYATIADLYGGDFIINQSSYGDAYNKLVSNDIARKGDKTNYNYDGKVDWAAVFGQAEYSLNKITVFATATLNRTRYQRVGNFWYGRDIYTYNSLGESIAKSFTTYTLKGGLSYQPTNRHAFYINGGFFTRPPYLRNAFTDARYSNEYREGLTTEKIASVEAGYSYRTSRIKANLNAYYLQWRDRTTTFDYSYEDESANDLQFATVVNGLVSLHKGIEADAVYNVIPSLELNGYVSLGDWAWGNSPTTTLVDSEGNLLRDVTLNIKGLQVGTAAQTTMGLGFHYRGIRSTYIGGRWLYCDRIPVNYDPEDLLDGYITREVIKDGFADYYTFSVYMGRYFNLSDQISGRISASVQNLTDEKYVRWATYFNNQTQRAYGYPRTYTIGLMVNF